jgi:hypothetical protein
MILVNVAVSDGTLFEALSVSLIIGGRTFIAAYFFG